VDLVEELEDNCCGSHHRNLSLKQTMPHVFVSFSNYFKVR